VSVVIPVYNHERFVGAAIDSVLSQTVRPREIICIDDGSTDSSARVLEAMAAQHPVVRFWARSNQGANRTINEGIRQARGRYVAILNSDDRYHPERLRRCLAVLEQDADVTAVTTDISFVDEHDNAIRYRWYEETHAFYEKIGDLGLALVNGNFLMTTSNIVARRTVFDEMGGFEDLRYAHDLDFFLRLVAARKRLVMLPEQLLTYRVHGSNTIFDSPQEMKLETALVIAFFAQRIVAVGTLGPESGYVSRILEITQRHQLTRLVILSLLHAQRRATGIPSPGVCLADPAFRSDASHEMSAEDVAPQGTTGDASVAPVCDPQRPVSSHGTTAIPPTWRRLLDRVLRGPLPRRFFTSIRWRSGLDADLQEIRERLDRVAATADASRLHAQSAAIKLHSEVPPTEAQDDKVGSLDTTPKALVTRGDTLGYRLAAVETSGVAASSRAGAPETQQTDVDRAGARSCERSHELAPRGRFGRPRNSDR
jgi:glycosyltransferase involved in cell wall biosynthesis